MPRFIFVLLINSFITTTFASNEMREMEYAEELESSITVGGIAWLMAKEKRFLTLYTETEESNDLGTAIILHPMDGHPNQAKLINPLRTYLPQHGWATLSLQMPILGYGANEKEHYFLFEDSNARINAALDFLVSAGTKHVVLIGYGLGGMMAVYYLKDNTQSTAVKAVVAISLPVPKTDHKNVQITDFISEIEQPFLDIFAEYDLPEVINTARKRRLSGKTSKAYRQIIIEGEGHLYQHDEGLVVKRIYSWMNRVFRGDLTK